MALRFLALANLLGCGTGKDEILIECTNTNGEQTCSASGGPVINPRPTPVN